MVFPREQSHDGSRCEHSSELHPMLLHSRRQNSSTAARKPSPAVHTARHRAACAHSASATAAAQAAPRDANLLPTVLRILNPSRALITSNFSSEARAARSPASPTVCEGYGADEDKDDGGDGDDHVHEDQVAPGRPRPAQLIPRRCHPATFSSAMFVVPLGSFRFLAFSHPVDTTWTWCSRCSSMSRA